MDYFAGLDISMDETHVCVLDREGMVVRESKGETTAQAVANELAKAPSCRRIVFETGRMAPILFHGLSQLGLPVVCVESRQAYQALKSLATHRTDRNDARGLAHLAGTGFFKPVHVNSLPAHAVRSLISARKKLVGQRVTLENQIVVSQSCSGSDCPARSPPPSSTKLFEQARGSPVSLWPCGD
jgi:transposase